MLIKGPDGQQTHTFSNAGYRESTDINTIGRGVNIALEPGQPYQLVVELKANHAAWHPYIALILRVRDLREEKLRAEFLSASKSRFIAQSSHDLSQPLNSMKLFLDHLKPHIQDASGNRIFQRLRRTHTQMSESFASIMDLSKLESGSLPAEKKPLALSTLFARLAPEYTLLAHEKGIRLTVHPSTLHVTSDPALLERMLRNLLSNAIKYTDEGRVVMGCRRRGQSVLIEILDTGCGIEESARPAVFDIYHRSANTSDRTEGSGIGLSIVKHIADLLDHPVTFQIPGTRGLDGLAEIKALYPALPLIVVSTIDHYASIEQMLRLGADGFISKTTPKSAMVQAIRDIMDGELVIISGQDQQGAVRLSPRQSAILELLAMGLSNKEIAAQINISPATVREHVSNLLERLDCENRTQVVLKARRLGFLLD